VLERPERRRGPAADAGLLVDVLDVVPDGLGRDAEILGDLLVRGYTDALYDEALREP
jgi:hypothetical protein